MEKKPQINTNSPQPYQLHTQNPDHLTLNYESLLFTVMGGVKLEGLHQLRCTLKAEHQLRYFRHSLDLYHNGQLESYIRKSAQKLELGPSYLETALNHLINQLEDYRLAAIAEQNKAIEKKILSTEEIAEAFDLLRTPNLLLRTNEYLNLSGIVGEEQNRLIMYIIFTTRLMNRPLHAVSIGSSGAGKSHLQEKVAECIPIEDIISNTSLTGTALYYYEINELVHKLLLFEDLDGLSKDALLAWRELMSKLFISRSLPNKNSSGKSKTEKLIVNGPACTGGCTTNEALYEDNANRCFYIYIDESKTQDKKVMEYQCNKSAHLIDAYQEQAAKNLLQNAQRLLRNIAVKNPFAPYLKLPDAVFKPRRTNAHYLGFIEAITFYKQYQRRWINADTGEIVYDPSTANSPPPQDLDVSQLFVETTIEDIEEANELMKPILIRKADELSGTLRTYLENIKNHLHKTQSIYFTSAEIRKILGTANSTITYYNALLLKQGYLQRNEKLEQEEKKKGYKTHVYQIAEIEDFNLLQSKIMNTLSTCVYNMKAANPSSTGNTAKTNTKQAKLTKLSQTNK